MAQSIWIKPILLENGRVLIEAGKKVGQLDASHGYEEKGQFVVLASGSSSRSGQPPSTATQTALAHLKTAKCWGKDLLIEQYGGSEFGRWKAKYKIEFSQGASSYVAYVTAGDYLLWNEGAWEEHVLSEMSAGKPVALVREASPRGIELTAWDESGFTRRRSCCPLNILGN